jgi:hypothetical protein
VAARPCDTGNYALTDIIDDEGQQLYEWTISEDEHRRLSELFGKDFSGANLAGTYVTTPPRPCSVCGKETEFIDW